MSILPDWRIRELSPCYPFTERVSGPGIISSGLSSYGYDLSLSSLSILAENTGREILMDPKRPDLRATLFEANMADVDGRSVFLPPRKFAIGVTVERIQMPRDCAGLPVLKSTYARLGLQFTPALFEPSWEGYPSLCFFNPLPYHMKLYLGEGIVQIVFIRGEAPDADYGQMGGKYQGQSPVPTPPRV